MARTYRRTPWPRAVAGWILRALFATITWPLRWPFQRRRTRKAAALEAARIGRAAAAAAGHPVPAPPTPRSILWARRKILHPVWVGLLLAVLAVVYPRLPWKQIPALPATHWGHLPWPAALPLAHALITVLLLTGAGRWAWIVGDKQKPWALLAIFTAAAWVTAAQLYPLRWALIPLTAGILIAASLRAWHFRIRPARPVTLTELEQLWADDISTSSGPLPGSRITPAGHLGSWDHMDPRTGTRLGSHVRVILTGKQTWKTAVGMRTQLAAKLGLDDGQVLIGRWRGHAGWADLIILDAFADEEEALSELFEFDGDFTFDPESGGYIHAVAADRSPVEVQIYDQAEGAKPSWFSGFQGTGKSGGLDLMLTETTSTGVVAPMIIDCKEGTSLDDWRDPVEHYIDVDPDEPNQVRRAEAALQSLAAVGSERKKILKETRIIDPETGEDLGGAKCLRVTRDLPFIPLILEEAPQLFRRSKLAGQMVQELLEVDRVCQIGVCLASQETTISAAFGGNGTIRKLMRMANRIIYRNAKDAGGQAGGAQSALPVDPSSIPEIVGAGIVLGPRHHRDILVRTRYVRYPAKWARRADIPRWDARSAAAYARTWERLLLADVTAWAAKQPNTWTTDDALKALLGRADPGEITAALGTARAEGQIAQHGPDLWGAPEPATDETTSNVMRLPASRSKTDQLRADIVAWVSGQAGPTRTSTVYATFEDRASRDAVDRALKNAVAEGALADAGRGLWAAPHLVETAR